MTEENTTLDADFPFEYLDEELNEDNVRAPDNVVREQLIPTTPIRNNAGIAGGLPPNIHHMSDEEQLEYIKQLSLQEYEQRNTVQVETEIERKIREDERIRQEKVENMKKKTEEYWSNFAQKLEPIILLSKRMRIDPSIRASCELVENKMNECITKRIQFVRMESDEFDSFYQFIHLIYPTGPSQQVRKRISDETYNFVCERFIID